MPRKKLALSNEHLHQIKQAIEDEYGKAVSNRPDCAKLSESINHKTGQYLSENSLRRFFGLISTDSQPSQHTLDILSKFVGFNDWFSFINENTQKEKIQHSLKPIDWDAQRKIAKQLSAISLQRIQKSATIPFEATAKRAFLDDLMDRFSESRQIASCIYAPSGFGKSIMLAHWIAGRLGQTEDIIYFINGNALANLFQQGFKLESWINQSVSPTALREFLNHFEQHPGQRKGKFWLVIDNYSFQQLKGNEAVSFFRKIMEFVQDFHDSTWIKVVLSVQPPVWQKVVLPLKQELKQANDWFEIQISDQVHESNIPELSYEEVEQIIFKYETLYPGQSASQHFLNLPFHTRDILRQPVYLQLYLTNRIYNKAVGADELSLVQEEIKLRLGEGVYAEEKAVLIQDFLKYLKANPNSVTIEKKQLLDKKQRYVQDAYEELLVSGFLKEESHSPNLFTVHTLVQCSNQKVLAYLIVSYWLATEHEELDFDLARKLTAYYKDSSLFSEILRWMILFAFSEGKYDFLKKIFSLPYPFGRYDYIHPDVFSIITTLGVQLRQREKHRQTLWPVYLKSELGRSLYWHLFVDIDYLVLHHGEGMELYLEKAESSEARLFGNCLLFLRAFLSEDDNSSSSHYEKIASIPFNSEIHPTPLGRKAAYMILYEHFYKKNNIDQLLKEIVHFQKKIPQSGKLARHVPTFQTYVGEALNWVGAYEESEKMICYALRNYILVSTYYGLPINHRLYLHLALAYVKQGKYVQAKEFFERVKPHHFDVHSKQFDLMNYYLVKTNFAKNDKKAGLVNKAREIEEYFKFDGYWNRVVPNLISGDLEFPDFHK